MEGRRAVHVLPATCRQDRTAKEKPTGPVRIPPACVFTVLTCGTQHVPLPKYAAVTIVSTGRDLSFPTSLAVYTFRGLKTNIYEKG